MTAAPEGIAGAAWIAAGCVQEWIKKWKFLSGVLLTVRVINHESKIPPPVPWFFRGEQTEVIPEG